MNRHEQEAIVNAGALQTVCSQLYQKVGVAQSDADTVAEMQVLMDLRGVHSHATRAVPGYVRGIINGGINPNPQLQTLEDNAASVLLDGDRGLGHLVGVRAMNIAVEKAKSASIGVAIVRNSNHFGAASSHTMRAVEHDMIGFATTNGLGVNVAVFGARSTSIGNNALSFAIPPVKSRRLCWIWRAVLPPLDGLGQQGYTKKKSRWDGDWMQMAMKPMTPGRLLLSYLPQVPKAPRLRS